MYRQEESEKENEKGKGKGKNMNERDLGNWKKDNEGQKVLEQELEKELKKTRRGEEQRRNIKME